MVQFSHSEACIAYILCKYLTGKISRKAFLGQITFDAPHQPKYDGQSEADNEQLEPSP